MQYVIVPAFAHSFESEASPEALIGSAPAPDQENAENVVSTFILDIIDPVNPFKTSDTGLTTNSIFFCFLFVKTH